MTSGFSLNTRSLRVLSSYGDALAKYHSIKPLRGSGDPGFRPLSSERKNKTVWIKLDPATGDVIAGYYDTDVLRYCKDGTLIIDCGGYHTMSTCDFIQSVSPLHAYRQHGVIWYFAYTEDGTPKHLPLTQPTRIAMREHGTIQRHMHWTVLNPVYPVVHSVSRKGAKELRDRYATFRKYLSAIAKVQTKGMSDRKMFDVETLRDLFGTRTHTMMDGTVNTYVARPVPVGNLCKAPLVHEFLPLCENEDTFMHALAWMWHSETNYLAAFDRVLMMAFPETYFIKEAITTGKAVQDKYAKYNH